MSAAEFAMPAEDDRARALRAVGASVREFSIFLEGQVGSRAASEDILREAFVCNRRELPQTGEPIRSWFHRSLREAVLEQPRHAMAAEGKLGVFRAELARRLEPSLEMQEAIDRHVQVLARTLAAEHAELLRCVDLGGEDVAGYARRFGMSLTAAAELSELARAELCRQVVRAFAACSTHGLLNCTCGSSLGGYGRYRLSR